MNKKRGGVIARNIRNLLLSAVAIFLSGRLLIGVEAQPGIAFDAANIAPDAVVAMEAITGGELPAGSPEEAAMAREMMASFAARRAVNADTAGWLWIPNICYYPIMYSSVPDYYLTHNPDREHSSQGAIFINYRCEPSFESMLTLVHGHNMKNATMFGQLDEYLGEDFFRNNGLIMIYDGATIRSYKPFTAVILEENSDVVDARELSDAGRVSYIQDMYERSICKMQEDTYPDWTSPVVFFSTCDYSFSEARLLVGAYMMQSVEVGE